MKLDGGIIKNVKVFMDEIEKIKKIRYNLSTKRALGLFPVEGFLLEEVQVFFSISVFLFQWF